MYIGIFFFLVIVGLLLVFIKLTSSDKLLAEHEYQKLNALFTPAERSFLGVLELAANGEVEIFGKVRVADVITPKRGQSRSEWQKAFNKISSKHFDYLICSKEDLSVICAIELNDKSHNSKKRKERDQFLTKACESSGLPLLQVIAKASYKPTEIREILNQYLPQFKPSNNSDTEKNLALKKAVFTDKVCPKCSSKLTNKVAKKGKHIGKEFWACSTFPKCRYIEK